MIAEKLPGIARKLYSHAVTSVAHAATFGSARGAWLLLTPAIFKTRNHVTVKLPGTEYPLTVRLHSTDVRVFFQIFIRHEYGWPFSAAPRVIVDAGGYTGLSAAFFAHKYPEATIIAIEPDSENFELLKLNTAHFANVHPVHAAVWWQSGTVSLQDPGRGAWSLQVTDQPSQLSPAKDSAISAGRPVRAVTIDEIIMEFGLERIDLLKVDVEGSEKEIFAVADSWISSVDAICIELHDRLRSGCSRSFFSAVGDFPIELRRNEDVLVARTGSPLMAGI